MIENMSDIQNQLKMPTDYEQDNFLSTGKQFVLSVSTTIVISI
jgi:hypothetical protein